MLRWDFMGSTVSTRWGRVIVVERRAVVRHAPVGLHGLNSVDEMGGERWEIARSLGLVLRKGT